MTNEQNDLLRSAFAIAQRKGETTNWQAFENKVKAALLKDAGLTSDCNEQQALRATCTPLTFRCVDGCRHDK